MEVEKENHIISQRYEKIKSLGAGGGGTVSLVKDKKENREMVMKVSLSNDLSCGIPMEYVREVKFFKELGPAHHPNILQMYDCFIENNRVHIVLERCKDDLLSLIQNKDVPLSISDIKAIMFDVLSPLQFCHSRYIAHRDIKPENYLIGLDKRLRLSDFGLSRYVGTARNDYTTNVQTVNYRAPEILLGARCYSTALDIWSVGCILGSLLLRAPLFLGRTSNNNVEVMRSIFYFLGTPTEETWPDMKAYPYYFEFGEIPRKSPTQLFPNVQDDVLDLLYRMLDYNPKTRITAEQALQHPFFTNDPPMTPFEDLPYWKESVCLCLFELWHPMTLRPLHSPSSWFVLLFLFFSIKMHFPFTTWKRILKILFY